MKKKTIALLLVMMMVFGITVGGTIAYLTDSKQVTNTFTVGKVGITLTETKTDEFGVKGTEPITATTDGVVGNTYKMMPGHTYSKDPVITVDAASENSFIFVKVVNGIAAYEAATTEGEDPYINIADQIEANGWTALEIDGVAVENVYYMEYTKDQNDNILEVFAEFKVADNADEIDDWDNINAVDTTIVITGYAVQADGMTGAADAWAKAGFGA